MLFLGDAVEAGGEVFLPMLVLRVVCGGHNAVEQVKVVGSRLCVCVRVCVCACVCVHADVYSCVYM